MRLVAWSIAFALGDALALRGLIDWRWGAGAMALAAAAFAFARGWRGRLGGTLALFAAGVVLGDRADRPLDLHPALAAAIERGEPAALEARVLRGPEDTGPGARLVVALTRIDGRHAEGTLALSVMRGWPDFGPGESIAFRARPRELRGTRNPGLPDPMLQLRASGVVALAGVAGPESIRRLAGPVAGGPRRWAFLARRALRAAIDREIEGEPGAFLRTAVLGDRRGVSATIEEGFRAAGATHVLSVSGLHLAAVAGLFFLLVRTAASRVPKLPLHVDPRAIAAAASLPAIAFFTLMTGEAIATVRSALMLAIGMAALLVARAASPGPTIAATALLILAVRPLALCDVSLQLSVASVAALALFAPVLAGEMAALLERPFSTGPKGLPAVLLRWLGRFGAATAAATAATAPLVAHWFGEVAPLAPLGNLALVPLVELVLVPAGLAGAVAGAVWAPLGTLPLELAGLAARAAIAVGEGFRRHAPIWVCRSPNLLETLAAIAALGLGLLAIARARWRRRAGGVAIAAVLVAVTSLAVRDHRRRHAESLEVTFLDVGQGDAAVIEAPGGAVMLIDGGGTRDGLFDPGARIIEPFLRTRGIGRVDVVALSHPHPDHMGGLFRIVERFDVGALWSSGDDGDNPEYGRLVDLARSKGVAMPSVAASRLGPVRIEPLGPFSGPEIAAPEGLSVNDASLVLRIEMAGRSLLFTGDLEADGEGELAGRCDTGQTVASDVLKVPHHGSRTSSSPEMIDAVTPKLAVISLGWRNQFRFPAPEVLDRYAARGIRVLRTDRDGAIQVSVAPGGQLSVRCERGCPELRPERATGRAGRR